MRDVVRLTGLPSSTIHFYMREGLLPRPDKSSPNQAVYDQAFVARAKLIKTLQTQANLPLPVIRSSLEHVAADATEATSGEIVSIVQAAIAAMTDNAGVRQGETVAHDDLLDMNVTHADLDALSRAGAITQVHAEGVPSYSAFDAKVAIAFAELNRSLGVPLEESILTLFATNIRTMCRLEVGDIVRGILEQRQSELVSGPLTSMSLRSILGRRDHFLAALQQREFALALQEMIADEDGAMPPEQRDHSTLDVASVTR